MSEFNGCQECKYLYVAANESPCINCIHTHHEGNYPDLYVDANESDNVNHPAHYETGKYECIEVMLEVFGTEAIKDFCQLNAFKYLYRCNRKNGDEDIKKALWYLNKYLEL